ncbi:MAG: hypothetical protein ACREUW_00830 [Burkholderiales bacterium]
MAFELRLHQDGIAPGAKLALRAAPARAIYVVSGGVRTQTGGLSAAFGANSAFHTTAALAVTGGNLPTVALRWELTKDDALDSFPTGEGLSSSRLLAAPMALDRNADWLLRCDRVDFPPKGEALLHTHQGGGTRCLLFGGIRIETQGHTHHYGPLGAWFEAGPDPVYAAASETEPSAFVRVMLLPRALLGKSSIAYVKPEDLAKPKSQRYQVFLDVPVTLPG